MDYSGDVVRLGESGPRRRVDALTALALAAGAGDRAAEDRLLEVLAPKIVAIVRATLSEAAIEADDVVQDALLALVKGLPSFRGEGKVEHYAARITLRVAIAARSRFRSTQQRMGVLPRLEETAIPESATPADQVEAHRRREAIVSLLETLPEEQADTLGLRVVFGYSLQEVASITGVPVNTVRSRVRLAKEALRKRIAAKPSLASSLEVRS
jgi:RNA polymerase sigma-70 factor (ECF subfamily)